MVALELSRNLNEVIAFLKFFLFHTKEGDSVLHIDHEDIADFVTYLIYPKAVFKVPARTRMIGHFYLDNGYDFVMNFFVYANHKRRFDNSQVVQSDNVLVAHQEVSRQIQGACKEIEKGRHACVQRILS